MAPQVLHQTVRGVERHAGGARGARLSDERASAATVQSLRETFSLMFRGQAR